MNHLLNRAWARRGLFYLPLNAVLTWIWVVVYEHGIGWMADNEPRSLTPLIWMVLAQTGASILVAEKSELKWPRAGWLVAVAFGQLAVPLLLLGSYALATLGLR